MATASEPPAGRRVARHVLGLLCFPPIGLGVALAWLFVTARLLGLGREGFGNAAAVVVMPVWAAAFGLAAWLPFWLLHARRWGRMSGSRALAFGALGGLLVSLVLMGPAGFTTRGGAELMAYAVIAMAALGAWAHNAIVPKREAG